MSFLIKFNKCEVRLNNKYRKVWNKQRFILMLLGCFRISFGYVRVGKVRLRYVTLR